MVFQRLRQPVVFGYLLAGMIVGPHIPILLVVDEETIRALRAGVISSLFSLARVQPSQASPRRVDRWAGRGRRDQRHDRRRVHARSALSWTTLESVYAGALIAISSTTIIAKAFEEQRVKGKFTDIVFGVLIIEDLIGIFLIAILTAISAGTAVSASTLAVTGARLATFLAGPTVRAADHPPGRARGRADRPS